MTLDEYIEALTDLKKEHGGELEVVDEQGVPLAHPEYVDDGDPAIVTCDRR